MRETLSPQEDLQRQREERLAAIRGTELSPGTEQRLADAGLELEDASTQLDNAVTSLLTALQVQQVAINDANEFVLGIQGLVDAHGAATL